jgi:hypothetical protein
LIVLLDFDNIREYDLNLSDPEDNPNGFTAYLLPQFQYENEYIEAIVLNKVVSDMEDMIGADKVSVSLLECGTKLFVQEPAVSRFMVTNYPESFSGFADSLQLHESILNTHEMLLHDILSDESRRTKKYILNLPAGYRCKMGYMNPLNGERLKGVLHYATTTLGTEVTGFPNDLECLHPSVTWIAVLDKEPKFIRRHAGVDAEFANLFQRMLAMQNANNAQNAQNAQNANNANNGNVNP